MKLPAVTPATQSLMAHLRGELATELQLIETQKIKAVPLIKTRHHEWSFSAMTRPVKYLPSGMAPKTPLV
jgi:hypothetical protein